ncbi:MAG: hypothetical protein KC457_33665, partial [Myxococcales bacterium]|nr:hypothetical protein [Myxococcales bacterium]
TAIERATDVVEQLRVFSGREEYAAERIDLSSLVASLAGPVHAVVPEQVSVRLSLHSELPAIDGDVALLELMVVCLVSNGAEAIADTGEMVLATGVENLDRQQIDALAPGTALEPGPYVWLAVQDNGPGIAPEIRERIFEPFFSTKPMGTGLGMAICHSLVQQHGGNIAVRSDEGTIVEIRLPGYR